MQPIPGFDEVQSIEEVVALPERFDVFYRREFAAVVGLAYALSGSRMAAEDLAQEAFMAAHQQWEKIGRYDKPGAWVRRVVANKSVSLIRRRASEARALARVALRRREALPALEPVDAEFWDAVRSLPRRQSQAIALHYLEDRPVAEIAEILGCAVNTAKVHLHKGRANLASRLGPEGAS
ncbi:MAG: SigE family RNA polymerase sigma factor [Acidimicrobiia bacterium]|nr:SigE family RNA polymerase sigma factor [Acidimicrobiia bacterium]